MVCTRCGHSGADQKRLEAPMKRGGDNRMPLDRLSLSTVPITPFFNGLELPEATGFIWKRPEFFYLITNWHVVSALDLFTKEHLLKGGSRPNKLRCHFLIRVGQYE